MPLPVVLLMVFLALAAFAVASLMVIRDLRAPSTPVVAPVIVRRPRTVLDEAPATTPSGRVGQRFERLIIEGGAELTPNTAMLVVLFAAVVAGGVTFVATGNTLLAIGAALLGMVLTLVAFQLRRVRRLKVIREQLPDVIDLLSRAVHAGETLEQAIALVGEDAAEPLGAEFRWCSRQLSLGRTVSATMHSLAGRINLVDLRLLATILAVHRKTGGNLALTLERLSGVSRDRLTYLQQMQAATGAGRISARLIAAAGPLLFLFMFFAQNEHIQGFFRNSLGQTLLITAIVLEVVGLVWISRLMKINY